MSDLRQTQTDLDRRLERCGRVLGVKLDLSDAIDALRRKLEKSNGKGSNGLS